MDRGTWVLDRALALGLLSEADLREAAQAASGAEGLLDWLAGRGRLRPATVEALGEEWIRVGGAAAPSWDPLASTEEGGSLGTHLAPGGPDLLTSGGDGPGPQAYPLPAWDRYEPLAFLGAGAMGSVFKALDPRLRRVVALKFLFSLRRHPEVSSTEEGTRHFLREARTQAGVDHPSVAKVFEIGEVDGLPYLAIQFVEGSPLDEAGTGLSLREKVELLEDVARGLHAVHRVGVIHRDIKPSNILVTRAEGRLQAVLTDFGLALSPELDERTQPGVVAGTPAFMSPEQARGGILDTRSDVYSLGATLFVLLSGRLPFPSGASMLSRIQTEPPEPLRGPAIPADIAAVVGRCLEKEPGNRYDSALALAEDLRRFLEGRPVRARAATLRYRSARWVGRNRTLAALTGLLLLSALGGSTFTAWNWVKAQQRIRRESQKAKAASDFLLSLFTGSDPGVARGTQVSARDLLDRGAERVERELKNQPNVQARVLVTLGSVYAKLGLYEKAQPLLEAAVRNQEGAEGEERLELADDLALLATLYRDRGRFSSAEPLFQRSLAIREQALGHGHPRVAASLNNLGNLASDRGQLAAAEVFFKRSLAIWEKALGPDHPDVAVALDNLGALYMKQSRFREAEPLFLRCRAIREKALPQDHPDVARSLNDLAVLYVNEGRPAEAEPLYLRCLRVQEKVLGPDHPLVADTLDNLGNLYAGQGRMAEAEPLYMRSLGMRERTLGPGHPFVALGLNNLGDFCMKQGKYAEAEPLFKRSLKIWEKALGPDNPQLSLARYNLACLGARLGRRAEALAQLARCLPSGASTPWVRGMAKDPDLASLHGDPEFRRILGEVERLASAP